jgi:hypothetical protein
MDFLNRAMNWGSQKQAKMWQVKNKAKEHYKKDDGQDLVKMSNNDVSYAYSNQNQLEKPGVRVVHRLNMMLPTSDASSKRDYPSQQWQAKVRLQFPPKEPLRSSSRHIPVGFFHQR